MPMDWNRGDAGPDQTWSTTAPSRSYDKGEGEGKVKVEGEGEDGNGNGNEDGGEVTGKWLQLILYNSWNKLVPIEHTVVDYTLFP
jgi:hypothetical protein